MEMHPIDLRKLEQETDSVYEAVIVAGKKARQINDETRLEFNTYLNAMVTGPEDEFEDSRSNPDQIKISKEFEKRPKPHLNAIQQVLEGFVDYRFKEEKEN